MYIIYCTHNYWEHNHDEIIEINIMCYLQVYMDTIWVTALNDRQ